METPEKLYILFNLPYTVDYSKLNKRRWEEEVEYIRTDVFIEKAVKFLKEWDAYRVCLEGHKDWFIEQFKKYMDG